MDRGESCFARAERTVAGVLLAAAIVLLAAPAARGLTPTPSHTPEPPTPTPTSEGRPLPVARATAYPNPARAGDTVTLDGSMSGPANIASLTWQQEGDGPRVLDGQVSGAIVSFTAPPVGSDTTLTFLLVACGHGSSGCDTDAVAVLIQPSTKPTTEDDGCAVIGPRPGSSPSGSLLLLGLAVLGVARQVACRHSAREENGKRKAG